MIKDSKGVKVSVVIPVYGVEQFIEKCAISLFSQTLKEMEFIFVNDCTQDFSMDVLHRVIELFPERKEQITIINHPENKGLPTARQTGIKQASGEYVAHCDSDDWVDTDMYRQMYEKAKTDDADIVLCDYNVVRNGRFHVQRAFYEGLDKMSMFRKFFSQEFSWNVWSKLVRRKLYDNPSIIYPIGTHGEDMALFLQLLYFADTISYVPKPFYYYVYNSSTVTHTLTVEGEIKKWNQAIGNVRLLEEFFSTHKKYADVTDDLTYLKLSQREKLLPLMKEKEYYDLWRNTYPEINSKVLLNPHIKFRHKLKFVLLYTRLLRH